MQTGLMKAVAAGMLVSALAITDTYAQLRFDIIAGASPAATPQHPGVIINREDPAEEFIFNVEKVNPQLYIGAKAHMDLRAPFFVEGGLTYSQRKSTYSVAYTIIDAEHPVSYHSMSNTSHYIMMPINVGVDLAQFDVTTGLRAYHTIAGDSELHQLNAFSTEGSFIQLGWQTGIGMYVGRTRIGVEYISDFNRVGSGMYVNGQSLELMNVHGQFALNVQQSF